jgi:hypothetical protein
VDFPVFNYVDDLQRSTFLLGFGLVIYNEEVSSYSVKVSSYNDKLSSSKEKISSYKVFVDFPVFNYVDDLQRSTFLLGFGLVIIQCSIRGNMQKSMERHSCLM